MYRAWKDSASTWKEAGWHERKTSGVRYAKAQEEENGGKEKWGVERGRVILRKSGSKLGSFLMVPFCLIVVVDSIFTIGLSRGPQGNTRWRGKKNTRETEIKRESNTTSSDSKWVKFFYCHMCVCIYIFLFFSVTLGSCLFLCLLFSHIFTVSLSSQLVRDRPEQAERRQRNSGTWHYIGAPIKRQKSIERQSVLLISTKIFLYGPQKRSTWVFHNPWLSVTYCSSASSWSIRNKNRDSRRNHRQSDVIR